MRAAEAKAVVAEFERTAPRRLVELARWFREGRLRWSRQFSFELEPGTERRLREACRKLKARRPTG